MANLLEAITYGIPGIIKSREAQAEYANKQAERALQQKKFELEERKVRLEELDRLQAIQQRQEQQALRKQLENLIPLEAPATPVNPMDLGDLGPAGVPMRPTATGGMEIPGQEIPGAQLRRALVAAYPEKAPQFLAPELGMDPLTQRLLQGMPSGGGLSPGVTVTTPTTPGGMPRLTFDPIKAQEFTEKAKRYGAASAALETVGRMRASQAPDYNVMLETLAPHLEDPRVGAVHQHLMAEQERIAKATQPAQTGDREAVAEELFDRPWAKLTQPEKTRVNTTLETRLRERLGERFKGLAGVRTVNMLDTLTGNRPVTITVQQLLDAPEGRYISQAGGQKALNQTALIEDIRGAIDLTRQSLANLRTDFTATQAAQLAIALGGPRAGQSAMDAILASTVGKTLTPEQIDYVTNLAQLKENAMAMRSVLGAGQGSDELRAAIMATLPSPRTPTRAYAKSALDKFEGQINRLARGVPEVPLRPGQAPTPTGPAGPPGNRPRILEIRPKGP